MLRLPAVINVNSLIWISSLAASERGTTERVQDDLHPYFVSIGLSYKLLEPRSAAEFLACLDAVERRAKAGLRPIIHIDTHGSAEQGILITDTNEHVSWPRLVEKLRAINVATKNNLCVVSAACFGLNAIWPIKIGEPAPFFALIAPEKQVSFGFVEARSVGFYKEVFGGLGVAAAHAKWLAPLFTFFHCERLLAIALVQYVRDHCMGKGLKKRGESLMTQVFESGKIANTPENRRMIRMEAKRLVRPNQALIDRYVQAFLSGKKVPFSIQNIMELAKSSARRLK